MKRTLKRESKVLQNASEEAQVESKSASRRSVARDPSRGNLTRAPSSVGAATASVAALAVSRKGRFSRGPRGLARRRASRRRPRPAFARTGQETSTSPALVPRPLGEGRPWAGERLRPSKATKRDPDFRPVLKHGPRSPTIRRVGGFDSITLPAKRKRSPKKTSGRVADGLGRRASRIAGTRKMTIYACEERSQGKLWWRFVAVLTCKSFAIRACSGERPIETSSSWFPPKFPLG